MVWSTVVHLATHGVVVAAAVPIGAAVAVVQAGAGVAIIAATEAIVVAEAVVGAIICSGADGGKLGISILSLIYLS